MLCAWVTAARSQVTAWPGSTWARWKHPKHDLGLCPRLSPPPTQCAFTFQPLVQPSQPTHLLQGGIKANKSVRFTASRCPGLEQHPKSLHLGLNPVSSSHLPVYRPLQLPSLGKC